MSHIMVLWGFAVCLPTKSIVSTFNFAQPSLYSIYMLRSRQLFLYDDHSIFKILLNSSVSKKPFTTYSFNTGICSVDMLCGL